MTTEATVIEAPKTGIFDILSDVLARCTEHGIKPTQIPQDQLGPKAYEALAGAGLLKKFKTPDGSLFYKIRRNKANIVLRKGAARRAAATGADENRPTPRLVRRPRRKVNRRIWRSGVSNAAAIQPAIPTGRPGRPLSLVKATERLTMLRKIEDLVHGYMKREQAQGRLQAIFEIERMFGYE